MIRAFNRQLSHQNRQQGFTLIELMIVVAIIAILAAIAIPNFINYQMKAKTSEAKSNLGALKTSQESYRAEYDRYLLCAAAPANLPGGTKMPFGASATFTAIGFSPAGNVFFSYGVNAGTVGNVPGGTPAYTAWAQGDLDINGSTTAGATGAAYTSAAFTSTATAGQAAVGSNPAVPALTASRAESNIIVGTVNANDSIFTLSYDSSYVDGHPGIW